MDGSSGTGGGSPSTLGARCTNVADCDSGQTCLTTDDGVPKGVCTVDCTLDTTACDVLGGACKISTGDGASYCAESCNFGHSTSAGFSTSKCHGRPEFACGWYGTVLPETACTSQSDCTLGQICGGAGHCEDIVTACIPECGSDADCAPDLFCDHATGGCSVAPATGDADGAACSQSLSTCIGRCINFSGVHTCASYCTVGSSTACGRSGAHSSEACVLTLGGSTQFGGTKIGDVGYCGQLCDCDGDCSNPANACKAFEGSDASAFVAAGTAFHPPSQAYLESPVPGAVALQLMRAMRAEGR